MEDLYFLAHSMVNAGHLPPGEGGFGTMFGAGLGGGLAGAAATGLTGEYLGAGMERGLADRIERRRQRVET